MPKEYKELRLFDTGTMRRGDESDLPDEAASFSINIDPSAPTGILQGIKSDAIVTSAGPLDSGTAISIGLSSSTSKGIFYNILNDDSKYHLIYYSSNTIKIAKNIFVNEGSNSSDSIVVEAIKGGSTPTISGTANSSLVNATHATSMVTYNKAMHIGMSDGPSKWVGIVSHPQFGHYQSSDGLSTGTFEPIIQDAALSKPDKFPSFQWVVHSNDGYIYAAEWKGQRVFRFRYNQTDGTYTYNGQSDFEFKEIHGIAARLKRTGESEPGCWVYDGLSGTYGTLFELFKNGTNDVSNSQTINAVNYLTDVSDPFFDPLKVGGICESYHETSGTGYIYFSKWLKNEPIIDPLNVTPTENTTKQQSGYKQSSFLWRTTTTPLVFAAANNTNASITLINVSPQIIRARYLESDRGHGFNQTLYDNPYQGFSHVHLSNPYWTDEEWGGQRVRSERDTGGTGTLQSGYKGLFLDYTTQLPDADGYRGSIFNSQDGFNTGKYFGSLGSLNDVNGDATVYPSFQCLKGDPYPSKKWHSANYNGSCVTAEKLTSEEYREDQIGLLMGFYSNTRGTGTGDYVHGRSGVAIGGFHRGKGVWKDAEYENLDDEGYLGTQLGTSDISGAITNDAGNDFTNQDFRLTGALYSSTYTSQNATCLNNGLPGITSDYDRDEAEEMGGIHYIDTYEKLIFYSYGSHIRSIGYDRKGITTEKNIINMNTEWNTISGGDASSAASPDAGGDNYLLTAHSAGHGIDTKKRIIAFGFAKSAHVGLVKYDSTGRMNTLDFPLFQASSQWSAYFSSQDIAADAAAKQGIADVALCPASGNMFIMAMGYTPSVSKGYIISNPYDENGITNFANRINISADAGPGNIATEAAHYWDPNYQARHLQGGSGGPAGTIIADGSRIFTASDKEEYNIETDTLPNTTKEQLPGLLFYTLDWQEWWNGTPNGNNSGIGCVQYDKNGNMDFTTLKVLRFDDDDYGSAVEGAAVGFRIDPVNMTLYGSSLYMGVWTARYDAQGNMKFISSVNSGFIGDNVAMGVDQDTSEGAKKIDFYAAGVGEIAPIAYPETASGNNGALANTAQGDNQGIDISEGGRASQVMQIQTYHADNNQDDSYSTGAMLYTAFSDKATTGTSKLSGIIGSTYNWQAHHIEVPRNALYLYNINNYQPLILRVNGFTFNHKGNSEVTIGEFPDGTGHLTNHGGCYGNMCGFTYEQHATDKFNLLTSQTWGQIMMPVAESITANEEYGSIRDSQDVPFLGDVSSGELSYQSFASTMTAGGTERKDRTKNVWATPSSASIVLVDNGTVPAYKLAIACGDKGTIGVSSIVLKDLIETQSTDTASYASNLISYSYAGGQGTIADNLIEKFPSPKIVGVGTMLLSDVADNTGMIHIFPGVSEGKLGTIPVTSSGATISETITDRNLTLVSVFGEPIEGSGYDSTIVGSDFDVFYKVSFIYDGYQESPLSLESIVHVCKTEEKNDIKVEILINSIANLQQNYPRITAINVYRATNTSHKSQNSKPIGFYRFVKQLKVSGEVFAPEIDSTDTYTSEFVDTNIVGESYEAATGIPEVFTDNSLKYGLSCQINAFHIVGKALSTIDPDITDSMIFKSRPYNFDQFNILNDRLPLQFTPTALASFAGRIWAFDANTITKIEPNQFYVEDTYLNAGCIDPKSIVVTEFGMFFADNKSIYQHDGQRAKPISDIINFGTYGWSSRDKDVVPVAVYDGINKAVLFYFGVKDNISANTELDNADSSATDVYAYAWSYSIITQRWDLIYVGKETTTNAMILGAVVSPYGHPYLLSAESNKDVLKYQGHTTNRENWWWHSKDFDFSGRSLSKKLNMIKLDGIDSVSTLLGGTSDASVGYTEDNAHPDMSPSNAILIEVNGSEKEGTSNYITKTNTSTELKFKLKSPHNTGKVFKIKLNKMLGTTSLNSIGLVYRMKGYR